MIFNLIFLLDWSKVDISKFLSFIFVHFFFFILTDFQFSQNRNHFKFSPYISYIYYFKGATKCVWTYQCHNSWDFAKKSDGQFVDEQIYPFTPEPIQFSPDMKSIILTIWFCRWSLRSSKKYLAPERKSKLHTVC